MRVYLCMMCVYVYICIYIYGCVNVYILMPRKVPGRQHNGQHLVWNHMHYKSCVVVQVSRTSVQLGEPNGNDGTWTMTGTKCAAIKRLISIMRPGDKTEFINKLKTTDLINRNGRISSLGKTKFRCLWMKCRLRKLHHNRKH